MNTSGEERRQVNIRLRVDLDDELEALVRSKNSTKEELFNEAIEQYLTPELKQEPKSQRPTIHVWRPSEDDRHVEKLAAQWDSLDDTVRLRQIDYLKEKSLTLVASLREKVAASGVIFDRFWDHLGEATWIRAGDKRIRPQTEPSGVRPAESSSN